MALHRRTVPQAAAAAAGGSCNSGIGDDDHDNDDEGGADCECQYSLDGITVAEGDEEEPEEAEEDDDDEMPFAWAAPDRGGFIHATGSDSAAANAAHSTAASAALDALSSQSGRLSTLSSQQVQLPPQLMGLSSFKSTTSGTSAAATPSIAASGAGVGAGAMGAYSLDQGSQFGAASDGSGGSATQVQYCFVGIDMIPPPLQHTRTLTTATDVLFLAITIATCTFAACADDVRELSASVLY